MFNPVKIAGLVILAIYTYLLITADGEVAALLDWRYLVASFFMGFGIAVDVMSATIGRFKHYGRWGEALTWAGRNTATHTIFPVIGIAIVVPIAEHLPIIKMPIGFLAAYFVFLLLQEEISGLAGFEDEEDDELPGWLKWLKSYLTPAWVAVIAVSVDALLSGPAKAVQTEGWSHLQVLVSFPIVGVVVGGFALTASVIAMGLKNVVTKATARSVTGMAYTAIIMLFIESVVIGYFGVLALLKYGLMMDKVGWAGPALISTVSTLAAFYQLWPHLLLTQLAKADEELTA